MAISFTTAQQIKLNTGACIDAAVSDLELGIRAIVGYHHYFMVGIFDAVQTVQQACDTAGLNWTASYAKTGDPLPSGAVRVGQCRVHSGSPAFSLYVCRRPLIV